ncbi:HIT domain-containing protein [bacterium]|nr:HIT domain-containing protein [bacterium]
MNASTCIFCKILNKQIPAQIIMEDEHVFVIKDITPKSPIHFLIIPKKHLADIVSLQKEDAVYAAAILLMAKKISETIDGADAFKLVCNNGAAVGQSVFHVHFHFLAGSRFSSFDV